MRFKGSFSHIHRVYLYGLKVILPLILLYLIYSWTFGDASFTEDANFFIENIDSFMSPVIIMLCLYFIVLHLVGRVYLTIDENMISYRQGFWVKRTFPFSDISSVKLVKNTVKGHDMPCMEIKTRGNSTFLINLFSFEKNLQTIVDLLKKGIDSAVFETHFDQKFSSWITQKNFSTNNRKDKK